MGFASESSFPKPNLSDNTAHASTPLGAATAPVNTAAAVADNANDLSLTPLTGTPEAVA
jgi:hypothetical protein